MANRRMFTKKVTDDDNFMALSSSAQALYLHLSMSADDDGFSNQVSISMFKAHASIQDLQALLEKRYIYQFENGVIVIKHWRMANALRKDRYTPTAFIEEMAQLGIKENGAYTWLPNGCQMVAECPPQVSIGKESIDKVKSINTLDQFEALWSIYPRKQGKKSAFESFKRAIRDGVTPDEIRTGIEAYCNYIRVTGTDAKYIKQGSTFFNQRAWADDWTPTRKKDSLAQKFEDMDSW